MLTVTAKNGDTDLSGKLISISSKDKDLSTNVETIDNYSTSLGEDIIFTPTKDSYGYGFWIENDVTEVTVNIKKLGLNDWIHDTANRNVTSRVRPVIFDTDFGWDIDDLFAIRILSWGVRSNIVKLLGVHLSKVNNLSVSAIDGALCAEGIKNLVFGAFKSQGAALRKFHEIYSSLNNHSNLNNSNALDSVTFYRTILSELPSGTKCDIIVIGLLNGISAFIESQPDSISPKNGLQLLNSKVNALWVMGGCYTDKTRKEANFSEAKDSVNNVLSNVKIPIYLQGSEIAESGIIEGEDLPSYDLMKKSLDSWKTEANMSHSQAYDPMVTLAALDNDKNISAIVYKRGVVSVNTDGTTSFIEGNGNHFVANLLFDKLWYQDRINRILENKNFLPNMSNNF